MNQPLKNYFRLLRFHQYIKNGLIFAPLFFGLKLHDPQVFARVCAVFAAFCLTASAVYIFNDLNDIDDDRRHPVKKNRPLASGTVPPGTAVVILIGLLLLGLGTAFLLSMQVGLLFTAYVLINLFYATVLRQVPIVDVSSIALGFVIRLYVGAVTANIELSIWIIVITYLLALFLALGKRRDDILIFQKSGQAMRKSVAGYNLEFLNAAMATMAAVVIVSYIMYTTSQDAAGRFDAKTLSLTTFFVVIGILRFMQITLVENKSSSPTKVLLKDRVLQITILAWLLVFGWILYR